MLKSLFSFFAQGQNAAKGCKKGVKRSDSFPRRYALITYLHSFVLNTVFSAEY